MDLSRRDVLGGAAALVAWPVAARTGDDASRAKLRIEVGERVLRPHVADYFLGFNLNSITTEQQYFDNARGGLRQDLAQALAPFKGAIYRYPGGLIADTFNWEWAIGAARSRQPQKNEAWAAPAPVRFGPQEYADFLREVGGRSWFTLNLVGWSPDRLDAELPSSEVAASNGRLARWRAEHDPTRDFPHYYQFGNELDRSTYEWPVEKYVARARETMAKVREADPSARFVAFLRDFDWTYRNGSGGRSKAGDFAAQVLGAMPEVEDYSLQLYYDRPAGEGQSFDIPWRLRLVDNIIGQAQRSRDRPLRVWVTENAKAKPPQVPSLDLRLASTSGISGAIASSDFILTMLERPAVQAALWHALGGGAWWDAFRVSTGRLEPTPVMLALRLLRQNLGGDVVALSTEGSNVGGYAGGYDLRAALLRSPERATLLVINRAPVAGDVELRDRGFARRQVELQVESLAASRPSSRLEDEMAVRLDPPATSRTRVGDDGRAVLTVPARSVSVARVVPLAG